MTIINQLTKRSLLKNKRRTIVTLIAVILTSTLLFATGFAYSTYKTSEINNYQKMGKDYDATINNMPFSKRSYFDNYENIKKYEYISKVYDTKEYYTLNGEDYPYSIYTISDGIKFEMDQGRLPENDDEVVISNFFDKNIGDVLKLNIIDKDGNVFYKEYKIVGIKQNTSYIESHYIYTKGVHIDEVDNTIFYIYLKNKKKAYDKLYTLAKTLGLEEDYSSGGLNYQNMDFNTSYLKLYGVYQDPLDSAVIYLSLILILTVISVFSSIIIYNSFSISLLDRIKQIGILRSVGMTKVQVRKLVFKEAFYVAVIAIPVGFVISLLFVTVIINYINFLQNGLRVFTFKIDLSYLLISFLFLILTIMYSAFFTSMRAKEITPMEAITQNKDIKVKKKKREKRKIFGIYVFLAKANMSRNKHKYRVAIMGSVVCMALFMMVATFVNFFKIGIDADDNHIYARLSTSDFTKEEVKKDVQSLLDLDITYDYIITEKLFKQVDGNFDANYTDDYLKQFLPSSHPSFDIITLDDYIYEKIKKAYQINDDEPLYINNIVMNNKNINVVKKDSEINFQFCDTCKIYKLHLLNEKPKELKKYDFGNTIIVNKEIFKQILDDTYSVDVYFLSKNYIKLDEMIKRFFLESKINYYYSNNGKEYMASLNDMKCLQVVLYTIIMLFAIITITSIINTISTSMYLRKREMAILKSVGLDNKGFNKILFLESFIIFLKTFIYGTIISMIIVYIISKIFSIGTVKYTLLKIFPTSYYIVTVISIFVIITLTVFTQLRKLQKDNIIENIKKENI